MFEELDEKYADAGDEDFGAAPNGTLRRFDDGAHRLQSTEMHYLNHLHPGPDLFGLSSIASECSDLHPRPVRYELTRYRVFVGHSSAPPRKPLYFPARYSAVQGSMHHCMDEGCKECNAMWTTGN